MSPEDKNPTILLILLAIVVLIAYVPAMRGGFVWDDDDYVQENRVLRSDDGLRAIWTEPTSVPQWYPLVHTTFWLEFRLWGLNPLGYHVTNVLIHIFSMALLYLVLLRLEVRGALLAAGVFGLHPVMVESVAWITERKNVLSLLCYLGSLLCYLRFEEASKRGPWPWYALSLVLFVGALLSKTVTCSMPAVVLLLIYWKRGRLSLKSILPTLPFFLVALPLALYTAHLEEVRVGAVGAEWNLSLMERVLVAGRAIWFYAHKIVWPQELVFSYARWQLDAGVWWQHLFWVGVVVVLVSLFLLRRRIGRGPLVAACIFCGTLTPALGFFSVYPMRYSFVADHFQYHASIALIVLVVAGVVRVSLRPGSPVRRVAVPLAALVLAVLGARTWWQCRNYKDLETLYRSVLEHVPDSWFAHNNLAAVQVLKGKMDDALRLFRRAKEIYPLIAVNPGDETGPQISPEAFANFQVGSILGRSTSSIAHPLTDAEKERRLKTAIHYFEKAVALYPAYRSAHTNLASAKATLGDLRAAEGHFLDALKLDPADLTSLLGLVNLHLTLELRLLQAGQAEMALSHYEQAKSYAHRALESDPGGRRARDQLVKMHARMGDILLRRGLRGPGERHMGDARAIQQSGRDR
jgi:protein O-mannosyl-transferase